MVEQQTAAQKAVTCKEVADKVFGKEAEKEVTEKEARAVAEEARESDWGKPSFAKELYLGRFQLELIHPYPRSSPEAVAKAERFLSQVREYCATLDGAMIEREARIPDE